MGSSGVLHRKRNTARDILPRCVISYWASLQLRVELETQGMIWRMNPFLMPRSFCIGKKQPLLTIMILAIKESESSSDSHHWIRDIFIDGSSGCIFYGHKPRCAASKGLG